MLCDSPGREHLKAGISMADGFVGLSWILAIVILVLMGFRKYYTAKLLGVLAVSLTVAAASVYVLTADAWAEVAASFGTMAGMLCIVAAFAWALLRIQKNRHSRWAAYAALVSIPAFIICFATASPTSIEGSRAVTTQAQEQPHADETSAPRPDSSGDSVRPSSQAVAPAKVSASVPKAPVPTPQASPRASVPRAPVTTPTGVPSIGRSQQPTARADYPSRPVRNQSRPAANYPPPQQSYRTPPAPATRPTYGGGSCRRGGYHVPGKVDRNGRTHCAKCGQLM